MAETSVIIRWDKDTRGVMEDIEDDELRPARWTRWAKDEHAWSTMSAGAVDEDM